MYLTNIFSKAKIRRETFNIDEEKTCLLHGNCEGLKVIDVHYYSEYVLLGLKNEHSSYLHIFFFYLTDACAIEFTELIVAHSYTSSSRKN